MAAFTAAAASTTATTASAQKVTEENKSSLATTRHHSHYVPRKVEGSAAAAALSITDEDLERSIYDEKSNDRSPSRALRNAAGEWDDNDGMDEDEVILSTRQLGVLSGQSPSDIESSDHDHRRLTNCNEPCDDRPLIPPNKNFADLIYGCLGTGEGAVDFSCNYTARVSCWDTGAVTSMDEAFLYVPSFNGSLKCWDTSSVTSMRKMFQYTNFNQSVDTFDTSKVTDMSSMFANNPQFNQPVGNWDMSSVERVGHMFHKSESFNQPLNSWNTEKVTSMENMFEGAVAFNQPLDTWDTAKVTEMYKMFKDATSFNQQVDGWNVKGVTNMIKMFNNAPSFNQCLASWAWQTPDQAMTTYMMKDAGCPLTTPTPNGVAGSWCQGEEQQCFPITVSPKCVNTLDVEFVHNKKRKKTTTCNILEGKSKKLRNKVCRKQIAIQTCPGICDRRCICKDKAKYRLLSNNKKYKCKNISKKQNQPACTERIAPKRMGLVVADVCPKNCNACN